MTRRVIAFVLALTIAGGTQGTLMYAATDARTEAGPGLQALADSMSDVAVLPGAGALGDSLTEGAVKCQRGANYCFGYFSYNCCAEMAMLLAIAGATGAWLAAGVGTYYYWYYC